MRRHASSREKGLEPSSRREERMIGSARPRAIAASSNRRAFLKGAGAGLAGIFAAGRAPAFAQTAAKKVVFAHINASPESAALAFEWFAQEVNKRSNGALDVQFYGSTLLSKELEIM